ncbi:MFS transporter [Arthrobacter sp. CAU 1506]|uniref:MFS transporter n=1 Tax=Arthrobacter sp. CAU 1506 TaxID=2560052 RepID=UPI0010ACFCFE|nr:MFS transporter [Arthrobacter sp. CAU 1506]TJY69275.1 MFS transporter [Arthrobacter sp. CAU 1506]
MSKQPSGALLFVLTCAMGVGPLLNYGLSTVSPLVIEDLGISEGQFGLLATAIFASAAVSSMGLGKLSDRISNRAQLVLIFAGTAVALVVAALAHSYLVLVIAALLAGPAQAISNPTTNRIIISQVPAPKRPGWIGVKQSGVQGSQLFAGLFFPIVALWAGWQGATALAAVVAVGLLLYGLRKLPENPITTAVPPTSASSPKRGMPREESAGSQAAASQAAAPPGSAGAQARFPLSVWLFAGYSLLAGLGMQATNVYLPLFTVRELGFSLVMGGVAAGVSGVVGVTSRVLWGRRMAKGVRASTLLILLGFGALAGSAAFLAAGTLDMPVLLWLGVILHGATVLGANVVVMAGVMRVVPAQRVGAASGIVSMGMYAGFAAGPLLMGLLLEATGNFHTGWLLVGAGYLLCSALGFALRAYGNRTGVVR